MCAFSFAALKTDMFPWCVWCELLEKYLGSIAFSGRTISQIKLRWTSLDDDVRTRRRSCERSTMSRTMSACKTDNMVLWYVWGSSGHVWSKLRSRAGPCSGTMLTAVFRLFIYTSNFEGELRHVAVFSICIYPWNWGILNEKWPVN